MKNIKKMKIFNKEKRKKEKMTIEEK